MTRNIGANEYLHVMLEYQEFCENTLFEWNDEICKFQPKTTDSFQCNIQHKTHKQPQIEFEPNNWH